VKLGFFNSNLERNHIGDEGALAISKCKNIEVVRLWQNNIQNRGAVQLLIKLPRISNFNVGK
jgi:hypothetical protein